MNDPAYVTLAGEYARRIRSGELPAGVQLPSYPEISKEHRVSQIVVRKMIDLLQTQGLVRSQRRRGVFVAEQPHLVRVSPERQMEGPEDTFKSETDLNVQVERDARRVTASEELAQAFGIEYGDEIAHVVTRVTEDGEPVSISDTYHPLDVTDTSSAEFLEEKVADRVPTSAHAVWLKLSAGALVKTVHQRFFAKDDRLIMISDVSYPRNRYDAMVFRMSLKTSRYKRPAND